MLVHMTENLTRHRRLGGCVQHETPICSISEVYQFQLHADVLHLNSTPLMIQTRYDRSHSLLFNRLTAAAIINAIAASLHALAADEAGAQVDCRKSVLCWYQAPLEYTYE